MNPTSDLHNQITSPHSFSTLKNPACLIPSYPKNTISPFLSLFNTVKCPKRNSMEYMQVHIHLMFTHYTESFSFRMHHENLLMYPLSDPDRWNSSHFRNFPRCDSDGMLTLDLSICADGMPRNASHSLAGSSSWCLIWKWVSRLASGDLHVWDQERVAARHTQGIIKLN